MQKTIMGLGDKRVSFTFRADGMWEICKYHIHRKGNEITVIVDTETAGAIMDDCGIDGYTIL